MLERACQINQSRNSILGAIKNYSEFRDLTKDAVFQGTTSTFKLVVESDWKT